MTPEQRTLAAAYLAEMWPVCRELPRDVRAGDAAVAAIRNADLEAMAQPVDNGAETVDRMAS
jgi:hypothetical protein